MKGIFILMLFCSTYVSTIQAKPIKKDLKETKITTNVKETKFNYASFDESKNPKNFLKFTGTSTKLKMFTTEFDGYAKVFSLTYEQNGNTIKNISLSIAASSLDTDKDSRNEKMWKKCLDTEKFPTISAATKDSIDLVDNKTGEMDIELSIKDKKLNRKLKYEIKKINDDASYEITFSTNFSFIEAGIEDPSIVVAKLGEIFEIQGKATLK
ncbi:MAG: YceI family protein [Bacteriovoracaceae bacterium]|nr:YceI family protein [Bacteriovoracaceae bacterium]